MADLLADHTTFRVGGPAGRFVTATSETEIVAAVREADAHGEPVLILSGGSNLLVSDEGFPGLVLKIASRGVEQDGSVCEFDADAASSDVDDAPVCGGYLLTVQAGEPWDAFVALTVDRELRGVEALSGIPGLVGSAPIQNIGAYGQDVSQTLWSVRTFDRQTSSIRTFANADCGFRYRHSRFKDAPGRYVVLAVTFQLTQSSTSGPIRFGELARRLNVPDGGRAPLGLVRDTVLALRRGKGMVDDPSDHDTWSAGSFFTNPILDADAAASLPADAPRFVEPDGRVKTSAAWLIERAGFPKGFGTPPATLSTKHTLALTNRGGARASDVVGLARTVRDGVQRAFGVRLEPEPVLIGVSLDSDPGS